MDMPAREQLGRPTGNVMQAMRDDVQSNGDREAAAAYVAELSRDLAAIARSHGLDALCYILEMARLEAENATRHANGRS